MAPGEQAGEPDPYRPHEIGVESMDMVEQEPHVMTRDEVSASVRAYLREHGEPVDVFEARQAEAHRRLLADIREHQQEDALMSPWRRLITGILDKVNRYR